MTWHETLLQKLAEWRPSGPGRHALGCTDKTAGWALTLEADRNDELGCLLWDLRLRRLTAATGVLSDWAERIAARVTSLIEPLKVVEVDSLANEALLRSAQPTVRGESVFYFEAILRGTSAINLRRYQASLTDHKPRTQIATPITHEALVKFIADAAAAAASGQ